jgi:hypothetical protein
VVAQALEDFELAEAAAIDAQGRKQVGRNGGHGTRQSEELSYYQ